MDYDGPGITELKALEGRPVSLTMTDGSRIDNAQLISAGRQGVETIWILIDGVDAFLPLVSVADACESMAGKQDVAA
jgi:hypothetical protein